MSSYPLITSATATATGASVPAFSVNRTFQATVSGTGAVTPRWGASINQVLTVDVDNVKASINFDPDSPVALVLNGTGQLVLPDLIRS